MDLDPLSLDGRRILVVGGRTRHISHYRRAVEALRGQFLHHDGGVEDNLDRLGGLFGRADAVVMPVDCVSHAAQSLAKRLCKQSGKRFIPVPRSGAGAFQRALQSAVQA
ncbi:MAG: DUF2325 domain-containing protein [Rhodospirillaceae bacterium]|nr:DUF2325 domain-containing protein [Rhodospirillales bacterium]